LLSDLQGKGSRLRTPFLSVFVNKNNILTGVESIEVTNASHFTADTFKLTVAIGKLPPDLGIDYWGNSVGDELEIFAGFKDQSGHAAHLVPDDGIRIPEARAYQLGTTEIPALRSGR
jgi:hypothetical protein